jgi:hypothetical protein
MSGTARTVLITNHDSMLGPNIKNPHVGHCYRRLKVSTPGQSKQGHVKNKNPLADTYFCSSEPQGFK